MNRPKDIETQIYFLPTEEGGRKGPVYRDYRPQFYYNGQDWDAPHEYPDVALVNPGETARAYLAFLSPQEHIGKIFVGMEFLIREGARTVGKGKITKIIELEKSARKYNEIDT